MRSTHASDVFEKLRKGVLDSIGKIRPPTCQRNTVTGWVGYKKVVHAMVRIAEGHVPLYMKRKSGISSRYDPPSDVKDNIGDAATPKAKSSKLVRLALCDKCKEQIPASYTVQARAKGLL